LLKALNAEQVSAIEEVLNIGLGRAAGGLTSIHGDEVLLTASNIHISNLNTGKALDLIKKSGEVNMVSVAQNVSGDLDTLALVLFSEANAAQIVQLMRSKSLDQTGVVKYEHDVMCEVGNIIINACVSAFANMVHLNLGSSLPVHHMGDPESVTLDNPAHPIKLLVNLDVVFAMRPISGFITFSFSTTSLQFLLQAIAQYHESESFEWLD
jgi:chemotaxis protein CheC